MDRERCTGGTGSEGDSSDELRNTNGSETCCMCVYVSVCVYVSQCGCVRERDRERDREKLPLICTKDKKTKRGIGSP